VGQQRTLWVRLPTREEVKTASKYPIEYFDRYFISWGEVCAAARTTGMSELPQHFNGSNGQLDLTLEKI
jgi:site-specific DNA-methyltransferase (adenine-specific)